MQPTGLCHSAPSGWWELPVYLADKALAAAALLRSMGFNFSTASALPCMCFTY